MAKNKIEKGEKGYYSPEAIQARQQAVVYEYNKAQEAKKAEKVEKPVQSVQPVQPVQAGGQLSPDKNAVIKKSTPTTGINNLPKSKPYLAYDTTANGLAFYGNGLLGWVRRSWADLTDPRKYQQDISKLSSDTQESVLRSYENRLDAWENIINRRAKWDDWGEKTFNLSARELAALPAGLSTEKQITEEVSKAEGDTEKEAKLRSAGTLASRAVRINVDTVQNAVWGGLEVLSLADKGMRKVHTFAVGLDAVADQYNKDVDTNIFNKLFQSSPASVLKDVFTVATAIRQKKLTFGEAKEAVSNYMAGSEMAYTMVFDEAMKKKFEAGMAEGKDPLLLAQEYGNVGMELAGSILGDPTTYLGLSLIKPVNIFSKTGRLSATTVNLFGKTIPLPYKVVSKIPTLGELIGTSAKGALADDAARFVNNAFPELENVLKNANNIQDQNKAVQIIDTAVKTVANKIDDMRKHNKFWNLASVDSFGKVRRVSSDADFVIKSMLRDYGLNDTLQVLSDMRTLRKGGQDAIEAAKRLIPKGGIALSDAGQMVGEIIYRMDGDKIFDVIKSSRNHAETYGELYRVLEGAVSEFVPSVDEMLEATAKIKAGDTSERIKQLADMAKDLPKAVVAVNRITRIPEAVASKATKGMVQVFMNLVPRSWMRNIFGQFVMTAIHTDMATALSTSFEAATASLKSSWADDVLRKTNDKIIKTLGYSPIEASKGIGDALQTGRETKGFLGFVNKYGFLQKMQRSEQITASQIVLKTLTDEIQKALPAVLKDFPEWDALMGKLPPEHQSVMFLAVKRANGNIDEAMKFFRDVTGKGEIEAWRLAEPSADMRRHLEATNMLDEFYTIQRSAQLMEDFKGFVSKFANAYDAAVTKAAEGLPSTATKMPKELYDFGTDLAKIADPAQTNLMTELIQSWENTLEQMDNLSLQLRQFAQRNIPQGTPEFQRMQLLETEMADVAKMKSNNFRAINTLREQIHQVKNLVQKTDDKKELVKLWNKGIEYKGRTFKLSQIYPDADLSKMTPKMFQTRMWEAFFETAADMYRTGNNQMYVDAMDRLEELAKLTGASLDDMAKRAGGDNPLLVLQKMLKESEDIEDAVSWQRFLRQFNYSKMPTKPDGTPVLLKDVVGKFQDYFPNWKGGQKHIVNAVNKGAKKVLSYDEITLEDAFRAIQKRQRIPPFDGTVSEQRILFETKDAFLEDVARWGDSVVQDWGVKVKVSSADATKELRDLIPAFNKRMQSVKDMAGRVAIANRNFILHDYDKTYMDHALTYLYGNSFHYWTTRTYTKMAQTVLDQPRYGNAYLAYKEYITQEHADMPDYYRQNTVIDNILGIDLENPYYLNLESMINPVYGLTGVDFNDPKKRVDWMTRTVDDMNKMGPSFSPLVSWGLAAKLYMDGKEGAAQRWLGRLLPQSQIIKSATAALFGKPIEIDPFVMLTNKKFLGGVDAYERNRVVAALAMQVRDGVITEEQMLDAARTEEGEIWEMGVTLSAQKRFTGDTASFFLGVGARPRTQEDMIINKFWGDYSALLSSRSLMSSDQYRQAWEQLRENPDYGMFVDGLLISRKTGDEQTTALAYNALSRIPPGEMSGMVETLGIKPYMIEAFYDNKGDLSSLTPQDRARFESAIIDLSAMFKMPDGATREEWNLAKSTYADVNQQLEKLYGDEILEKINKMYELEGDAKDNYLDANPEVQQALQTKNELIVNTPILSAYYGGLEVVERYYNNQVYDTLEQEFGEDIDDKYEQYQFLLDNLQKAEAKQFFAANNLKAYVDRRNELYDEADKLIIAAASQIPEGKSYTIRPDFQAQGGYQEEALSYATTDQQAQLAENIWNDLTPAVQELVQESIQTGDDPPYQVMRQIERIADRYGISQYEAMRLLGVEVVQ